MAKEKREPFDALIVPLKGSNLIEASAGTGKTYSIAILVLRLILEKDLSIREILMVTFTKAAIAELEERIRIFVRIAYRRSSDEKIDDATISKLVDDSIKRIGKDETTRLLREAVVYLDETSVLTIHSFCQQTLSEFAFETNQVFETEILQDNSTLLLREVQQFWRKYITVIPSELLSILLDQGLGISSIKTIVKNHLAGKRFQHYDHETKYSLCDEDYEKVKVELKIAGAKLSALETSFEKFLIKNKSELIQRSQKGSAKRYVLPLIDDHEAFISYIRTKKSSQYIADGFPDILEHCDECEKLKEESKKLIQGCLDKIYCLAINEISLGLNQRKLITGQLSYDDLIENLHLALTHNANPSLVAALQKKYKAVFVDEFQDTDRFQYEIFHEAFGKPIKKGDKEPILFYIGDPKQSIYSFRKADIFTYFKAYSDVDHIYEMNINYRSSEEFIQAMNNFFLPEDNFDTFYFKDQKKGITYLPVSSPPRNTVGQLVYDNSECIPISIDYNFSNKPNIQNDVAKLVLTLLVDDKYVIIKDGVSRRIVPSDIGILVRKSAEGLGIQNALAKYHIPSVTMSDAKVLSSNEARELYYLLEAFLENSRSNINRALLTSFTGYNAGQIIQSDMEKNTLLFNTYKERWEESGIYSAIKKFINDFGVQKHLLEKNTENGERIITNLYQLTELLFRAQHAQNLGPAELIDWLKRAIEQEDAEGDELEQRIENDEEAVKIVTIHSSKGLQYNIVIAPSLDMLPTNKFDDASYRDEETSEYISGLKKQFTPEEMEIVTKQVEQENRRLLYVTLTRTVYKTFIYKNTNSRSNNSTLTFFTNAAENFKVNLIGKKEPVEIDAGITYQYKSEEHKRRPLIVKDFLLEHSNWKNMSYTMLASEVENRSRPVTGNLKNTYDRFIFSELAKGNITGNLLHFIFENINFSSDEKWTIVVERAIQRFAPARKEKYELNLLALIQNVLNAEIVTKDFKFNLSEINFDKRIHELEFDFPVSEFDPQLLSGLADENVTVNVKKFNEMEGVMNGKIDMFFEYKGQYFVLDWKSTFLGDSLEDYNSEALSAGMNDHNYHLQYLIYSLAAKKYLESRLTSFDYQKDFGGVFYLFVRGMREGKTEGIFHTKPSLKTIENMESLLNANVNLNV